MPLALCDATTFDVSEDCMKCTNLFPAGVQENYRIKYNDKQKRYYLGNQMPHGIWVFKSTDSDLTRNNMGMLELPDMKSLEQVDGLMLMG